MKLDDTLRKGRPPKDVPAALAWLWRIYATLRAMFTENLPELEDFKTPTIEEPEFTVVAWTSARADATEQIRKLWPSRADSQIQDSIRLYVEILRERDRAKVLGHVSSKDPKDVDFLIADASSRYPRGCLTLLGPGVAVRLNRKARRAALARVRRSFRREDRADAAGRREAVRKAREVRDRARRPKAQDESTFRRAPMIDQARRIPGPDASFLDETLDLKHAIHKIEAVQ